MSNRLLFQLLAVALTQAAIGCSRFVWNEEPFTPDPAPTSEVIASGSDTTYVLRGASYYLLTPQRDALWNREVIDDVAWRYRALFREAPPPIAIRIDTGATTGDADDDVARTAARPVSPRHSAKPPADAGRRSEIRFNRPRKTRRGHGCSRARCSPHRQPRPGSQPERWKRARDGQPAWRLRAQHGRRGIGAGVDRGGRAPDPQRVGAPDRAAAELRANEKAIVPLASLFAAAWQRKPNAMDIARAGSRGQVGIGDDADDVMLEGPARPRARREPVVAPGVSPMFLAQSVSVLAFIHEPRSGARWPTR